MIQLLKKLCVLTALVFMGCATGNSDANIVVSTEENVANNTAFKLSQKNSSLAATAIEGDSAVMTNTTNSIAGDTLFVESLLKLDSDLAIIKRFGKKITHARKYSSEVEGSWPVTLLFAGTNEQVEFEWRDTLNFTDVYAITIWGKESKWKTKAGVRLGTSLKELEKLNGKPFLFYYLGWNFQGEVFWEQGKLSNQNIFVTIDTDGKADPGLYYPQAPELISSASAAARNSDLMVVAISFHKN